MMKESGNSEYLAILDKPKPYLYTDFYHKMIRVLRFLGKAFIHDYPRVPSIGFTLSESEKDEISEDTGHVYVSISVNRDDYLKPQKFERGNLYHNIVTYIDQTYGYKTGRVMDLIQYLGYYTEKSELQTNNYTKFPNIAFLIAEYDDAVDYEKWYQKYGQNLTSEEIISNYPLFIPYRLLTNESIF